MAKDMVKSYRYNPKTRVLCIQVLVKPYDEFYEQYPKPPGAQAIINSQIIDDYRQLLPGFLDTLIVDEGEYVDYGLWKFISARVSGDYIIIRIQGTNRP